MASVYKSLGQHGTQDGFESDEQDSSDRGTDESSNTVQADSDQHTTRHAMSSLPTEIKNRVLMLTTRGVSHRYGALFIHCLQAHMR